LYQTEGRESGLENKVDVLEQLEKDKGKNKEV
jgi:hypothetical protein